MTFLDPRVLYNAYANSTAPNPANGATLNFVGSTGFLCRPDMATETDPNSGITYRTEIETAITNNGFFPLDIGQTPFTQVTLSSVPSGEVGAGTSYPADVLAGGKGYCFNKN